MFQAARRRITYANVAATLALVFAMSGGAYAAKRYLITSTKQISPSVLKSLKGANGKNGAAGATGPQGPAGAAGAKGSDGAAGPAGTAGAAGTPGTDGKPGKDGKDGKEGSPWTAGGTLPAGATETGAFSSGFFRTGSEKTTVAISFPIALAAPLDKEHVHIVTIEEAANEGPETKECPGTADNPQANPGNFCLYEGASRLPEEEEGEKLEVVSITKLTSFIERGASISGANVVSSFTGFGEPESVQIVGAWAVTGS
jgi:hypothetical protein